MSTLPVPGVRWGDYPERTEPAGVDRWRRAPALPWPAGMRQRAQAVWHQAQAWQPLAPEAFAARRSVVQARLLRAGLQKDVLDLGCAYVAEAARRALGWQAYVPQLMAALALLDNRMVEMATGEGKSLAAALAAGVGALAGIPVHVFTANDYLVERDASTFAPLYGLLGLRVASVVASDSPDTRRAAYAQPVVYGTAREVAFDYLRDRLSHGAARHALQRRAQAMAAPDAAPPLLRGLCMAVIDEADNILVDEAQMPLVLSREVRHAAGRAFLWQAHALAGRLQKDVDYVAFDVPRRIELTDAGRAHVASLAAPLGLLWMNTRHRDETVVVALTALHLLQRDRDYVRVHCRDAATGRAVEEIAIVDRFSGRIAQGRKWSRGLHALVAIKEGCVVPQEVETLAQITFQRFFRRYHRLGGMSGTLHEARGELRALYGCALLRVPLRLQSLRQSLPARCYADDAARVQAVVARVLHMVATGRPVLIGCDSVEASATVAAALQRAGIPHAMLNATFDSDEARTVAQAGRSGQVTVATNMAGRGTDIRPDPAALAAGGLHVLSCQRNDSQRHDRQLAGRAARQGEPGSHEIWLALNAEQAASGIAQAVMGMLSRHAENTGRVRLPGWVLGGWLRMRQHADEARQARRRRQLFRQDLARDYGMSFSGANE